MIDNILFLLTLLALAIAPYVVIVAFIAAFFL